MNVTSIHETEDTVVLITGSVSRGAGIIAASRFWPNAKVPYHINGFNTQEQDTIKLAMRTLQFWTCSQFVPYDPATGNFPDYIVIENGTGCSSSLGRKGGRQDLVLESPKCFEKIGTVLHELSHVLGVIEEVRRSDRDQYVVVYEDNVEPNKVSNFSKLDSWAGDDYSDYGVPYDYNSVMHFGEYEFSANNQKTVEPKTPGAKIGQRDGISVIDALVINKMYNCSNAGFNIPYTNLASRILPNYSEDLPDMEDLKDKNYFTYNTITDSV